MNRIDANPAGSFAANFSAGQQSAAQSGRMGGTTVTVRDQISDLTNAAEELSLHMSEKVESKTHGERHVKAAERPQVMDIGKINEYLDKAKNGNADQLEQAARNLLKNAQQNPGQLGRGGGGSQSPTEQYLMLQLAKQLGPSTGASPGVMDRIEDALGDLEALHGREIRTNLSTIDQASAYGQNGAEVKQFQGSVQVVLGKPTISQALQEVLQLAGRSGARFESALTNLMGALGACLAAARSATEKVLLETLMSDLYHLKSIKTMLEECKGLIKSLKRQRSKPAGKAAKRAQDDTEEDDEDGQPHGQR